MPSRPRVHVQVHVPARFPDEATRGAWRWVVRTGDTARPGSGTLADLPAGELTLVLPPERVSTHRVTLPPATRGAWGPWGNRSGRDAQAKLLPLAIEEALAIAPEEAHVVALGAPGPGGECVVAALDRHWLAALLDALAAAGHVPRRAVLASALVASHDAPGHWRIVQTGPDEGWVHCASGAAAVLGLPDVRTAEPPLVLRLLVDEARERGEPPTAIVACADEAFRGMPVDAERWSEALGVSVTTERALQPAALDSRAPGLANLLTGPFANSAGATAWLRALRGPAIAAAALAVAHVGALAFDHWQVRREADALRVGMRTTFLAAFPDAKAVVDPALQMQRNLVSARRAAGEVGADDLIALLAALGPRLDALDARAQSLRYDANGLELEVDLPGTLAVPALTEKLAGPGAAVRVERAVVRPGGTRATLRVTGAAS